MDASFGLSKYNEFWGKWNLRGFIIVSLSMQIFLILCAPLRKRRSDNMLIWLIWSAYLLADWAANFALGSITSTLGDIPVQTQGRGDINGALLALWAPFLLLHLGGQDTIISFAIEDNALWLRQVVWFVFHVIATVYVFLLSFDPKSKLAVPTFLLFLAGGIKYVERIRAMYLASPDGLKETMIELKEVDSVPTYAEFLEEYQPRTERGMENNIAVVQYAYRFFTASKGLIVGLLFSYWERRHSRVFFQQATSSQALHLIAVELNFMYDALFTMVVVVHSTVGYILRVISFSAVAIALGFFYKLEKHGLHGFDVGISYTLFYAAIGLDTVAVIMLLFSDWTVVALNKSWKNSCIGTVFQKNLRVQRSRWCSSKPAKFKVGTRKILFTRWRESVSAFSFIDYSVKERIKMRPTILDYVPIVYLRIVNFCGLKGLRDAIKYTYSSQPLSEELWDFIFLELKRKSMIINNFQTATRIYSARGDWILQDSDWKCVSDCRNLIPYIADVDFDQSILLWHIATELCYNIDDSNAGRDNGRRQHCKTLSDYVLYLLIKEPVLMSPVAGIFGEIGFRDTFAEAKRFFGIRELGSSRDKLKEACEKMLEVNTDFAKPAHIRDRGKSRSVLFGACTLAKELLKLEEKKWDLMSEVWVEMLSYAASHCSANSHAQLLTRGGELITFVWLLMARLGIMEQKLQIKEEEQPRPEPVVRDQVNEC